MPDQLAVLFGGKLHDVDASDAAFLEWHWFPRTDQPGRELTEVRFMANKGDHRRLLPLAGLGELRERCGNFAGPMPRSECYKALQAHVVPQALADDFCGGLRTDKRACEDQV